MYLIEMLVCDLVYAVGSKIKQKLLKVDFYDG